MMHLFFLLIHADPAGKMTDVEIKKAILGQKPAGQLLEKDVITGAKREPTIAEVASSMRPAGSAEEARLRTSRWNEKNPNR